jgi:polyisoprenoid-binding protein YceI
VQNSSITNLVTFFAAGGGGGGTPSNNVAPASQSDGFGALGGSSVGGNGGVVSATKGVATAGTANTGSGGGGGGWNANYSAAQKAGGSGADGVIYLKFTKSAGTISSISITSSAGADSVYTFGETLTVTINWSEIVTIEGAPRIPIQGLSSKFLTYSAGSDSTSTAFIYVPGSSDYDADGVAINANTLDANGGSFKDVAGVSFTITHLAISASSASVIDGRLIGSVNSMSFSTTPVFRSAVTITVSVSVTGTVLFRAKGAKISNCVKRSTSGSSPNITATCTWRPSTRGATPVTATITPTNGSYSVGSLTNSVFVLNRSGRR